MLIGEEFNNRAKQLLIKLADLSDHDPKKKIAVEDLVKELGLDRTELKNLLGYLEEKDLIRIATIGGPFLYGHLHITEKGLYKAGRLK
ncbi:MAG TPA: hypothetical protein DD671_06415 [Balneolaceae bacterium]|nr:hypothetical protein [Balneolaceae bacterium]